MQAARRHAPTLALATLAALSLAAALPQDAQAQTSVTWTGSGSNGTDPYGQAWVQNAGSTFSFGIPGAGRATRNWAGPDSLTEFDVTFNGLAPGVSITPVVNSFGLNTLFFDATHSDFWDGTLTGSNAVKFTAPAGTPLTPGTRFFFNVFFSGDPAGSSFVAHYNATPAASTVPEPSSVAAFAFTGLGAAGLILRARKRQAPTA